MGKAPSDNPGPARGDKATAPDSTAPGAAPAASPAKPQPVPEIGGFKGPEPTRYGDWEHNGRCTDF